MHELGELVHPGECLVLDDRQGRKGMKPSGTATSPTIRSWRRVVWKGALLGLVLSLHLVLFLVLTTMRARAPDSEVAWRRDDHIMRARLLQRTHSEPRRFVTTTPSRSSRLVKAAPKVPQRIVPAPIAADANAVTPNSGPAPIGAPLVVPSQDGAAEDYGDPFLRKALHASTHPQRLPGMDDSPLAGKLHVIPKRSLEDTVRSIGNYMNCSAIEMARNRPGQLNVVQIADAYSALGCKK